MTTFGQRHISLSKSYRLDVAQHLAGLAQAGSKATYGELAKRFGGTARGWGRPLTAIAIRCRDAGYPLLSVLVVNAATERPSIDAEIYAEFGLVTPEDIVAEQQKCFEFNWTTTPLAAAPDSDSTP